MVRRIRKNLRATLLAAALLIGAAPVLAWDGVALETGHTTRTDVTRMAMQWQWPQKWLQGANGHIGGYWDLSLADWRRSALPGERTQLGEIGLTPVFRAQTNDLRGFYLEAGIGAHLLSATRLGNKRFGSAFQFGEHLGIGYRLGARGAADISYRYQHLSNANISDPNHGIEFHQIRLQYWLQ